MWYVRLTYFLFGWHWVWVKFGSSDLIRRIKYRLSDKKPYYVLYNEVCFLNDKSHRDVKPITFTEKP